MTTYIRIVETVGFPLVVNRCKNWTLRTSKRKDTFKVWIERQWIRAPQTVRRTGQSVLD